MTYKRLIEKELVTVNMNKGEIALENAVQYGDLKAVEANLEHAGSLMVAVDQAHNILKNATGKYYLVYKALEKAEKDLAEKTTEHAPRHPKLESLVTEYKTDLETRLKILTTLLSLNKGKESLAAARARILEELQTNPDGKKIYRETLSPELDKAVSDSKGLVKTPPASPQVSSSGPELPLESKSPKGPVTTQSPDSSAEGPEQSPQGSTPVKPGKKRGWW